MPTRSQLLPRLGCFPPAQERLFGTEEIKAPPHKYHVLLADPPWNERGAGKSKRGADRHYPLLSTPKIIEVMRESGKLQHISSTAHCYLWVTNNFLIDGIKVMEELGFRYVTNIVWIKPSMGLGQYFRGQHELMLFGVRGKGYDICTPASNIPSVIVADRQEHSRKPEEAYQLIEARSNGPYLEMFARRPRGKDWEVWGNEV